MQASSHLVKKLCSLALSSLSNFSEVSVWKPMTPSSWEDRGAPLAEGSWGALPVPHYAGHTPPPSLLQNTLLHEVWSLVHRMFKL